MLDARNVLDAGAWQAEGWVVRGLRNLCGGVASHPAGSGRLSAAGRTGMLRPRRPDLRRGSAKPRTTGGDFYSAPQK